MLEYISQGVDVSDINCSHPIHLSCRCGHLEMAQWLASGCLFGGLRGYRFVETGQAKQHRCGARAVAGRCSTCTSFEQSHMWNGGWAQEQWFYVSVNDLCAR